MGWFDENGGGAYEQGGITGGNGSDWWQGMPNSGAQTNGGGWQDWYAKNGGVGGIPDDGALSGATLSVGGPDRPASPSGPSGGQASHEYLLGLLHNGMKPQDAIEQTRQYYPQDAGLYYGNNNTIGMSGYYLASGNPNDPNSWNAIQRTPEGPQQGGNYQGGGFSPEMGQSAVAAAQAVGGGRQGGGNYLPADFQYEKFDPNSVDMSKDPGVAFRLKEAQHALENSAAQKGTLFSGGFAKALNDRTQDYASQEYQNAFSRAMGVNQANNQGGLSTYNAKVNAHLGQGGLDLGFQNSANQYALGIGNLALGGRTADQNYDLGLRNNALGYTQASNAYSLGNGQLGLGWANYGLNADNQNFGQGVTLAGMGLSGAGQTGSYGSSYAANQGNTYMGQGNANASGQVGAANAWGQAFGNGANNAAAAYYYGQGRK